MTELCGCMGGVPGIDEDKEFSPPAEEPEPEPAPTPPPPPDAGVADGWKEGDRRWKMINSGALADAVRCSARARARARTRSELRARSPLQALLEKLKRRADDPSHAPPREVKEKLVTFLQSVELFQCAGAAQLKEMERVCTTFAFDAGASTCRWR